MKRIITVLLFVMFLGTAAMAQAGVSTGGQNIAEQVRGADSSGFVADVLTWYDAHMNYEAVGLLMTIESSFVPFPSEVIIPPAVYVASNPDTKSGMKIWLIILFGTLGAMLGAYINYFLSRWLGRPVIYAFADSKLGHILQLSKEKVQKAETYFNDHGNISTLVGRLIPVIRQLISIPAGLSKMNLVTFSFFTFLGAAIWNCILGYLGYLAYQVANPAVIAQYSRIISIVLVALLVVVVVFFVVRAIIRRRSCQTTKSV